MDLLQHRSRWGGAVHFALTAASPTTNDKSKSGVDSETAQEKADNGIFVEHMEEQVGTIVNSYTPTQSNNVAVLKEPSFENTWWVLFDLPSSFHYTHSLFLSINATIY